MATYGGVNIFGTSVKALTNMAPISVKRSAFFGLEGLFQIYGGGRGGTHVFTGTLQGSNSGNLEAAINTFKTYADGIARTLVDTTGTSWNNVVLDDFQLTGERRYDAANGLYMIDYRATFTQLI